MNPASLCQESDSQLILIDIQARLAEAMHPELRARAIANAAILAEAARELAIPLTVTRQYPKGLGELVPELSEALGEQQVSVDKTSFSCCGTDPFLAALDGGRKQAVIAGMETHVCVLQTAHDLLARGYRVFVVEDAVCSRRELNHHNALARLRQAGVIVTNTESVMFEWLRDARHEQFKSLSRLIK
jgi:nicotinamidase-related amidase